MSISPLLLSVTGCSKDEGGFSQTTNGTRVVHVDAPTIVNGEKRRRTIDTQAGFKSSIVFGRCRNLHRWDPRGTHRLHSDLLEVAVDASLDSRSKSSIETGNRIH